MVRGVEMTVEGKTLSRRESGRLNGGLKWRGCREGEKDAERRSGRRYLARPFVVWGQCGCRGPSRRLRYNGGGVSGLAMGGRQSVSEELKDWRTNEVRKVRPRKAPVRHQSCRFQTSGAS